MKDDKAYQLVDIKLQPAAQRAKTAWVPVDVGGDKILVDMEKYAAFARHHADETVAVTLTVLPEELRSGHASHDAKRLFEILDLWSQRDDRISVAWVIKWLTVDVIIQTESWPKRFPTVEVFVDAVCVSHDCASGARQVRRNRQAAREWRRLAEMGLTPPSSRTALLNLCKFAEGERSKALEAARVHSGEHGLAIGLERLWASQKKDAAKPAPSRPIAAAASTTSATVSGQGETLGEVVLPFTQGALRVGVVVACARAEMKNRTKAEALEFLESVKGELEQLAARVRSGEFDGPEEKLELL